MVWKKNLLLTALALLGAAIVGQTLLSSNRVAAPLPKRMAGRDAEFREVVRQVDREFEEHWSRRQLTPADPAPARAVMRRISLGLTGMTPAVEELRAIERAAPERPLEWWVDRLLQDRRFSDHVSERLTRAYVGTDNGPFLLFRRERFRAWLADSLHRNTPYDELVRSMLSGEGLWTGSPEVNFVTATLDANDGNKPDPIRLAGRTSRAFLGMRIDCLQCHDDRLAKIKLGDSGELREGQQRDFHQLAAFFSQASVSVLGIRDGDGLYKYKFLNAEEEVIVPPVAPFLDELVEHDASLPRRQQLARWVTAPENRSFARAAVNRVWAILFGLPLVSPIDDMPLSGPFPPGLERLADDFVKHGYDLQRLVQLITSLRVFQIDSRASHDVTPEHEAQWAVFPMTRLRPDQMAGSIVQACSLEAVAADRHVLIQVKAMLDKNRFVERYGDTGEDEFQDRGGTIPQRLIMMNGDLVKELTREGGFLNAASRIAGLAPDNRAAIQTVYLSTVTRAPTDPELEFFVERLGQLTGRARTEAIGDLYWALMNSTEFSWNH